MSEQQSEFKTFLFEWDRRNIASLSAPMIRGIIHGTATPFADGEYDQQRREAAAFRWLAAHLHSIEMGKYNQLGDNEEWVEVGNLPKRHEAKTLLEAVEAAMAATDGGK